MTDKKKATPKSSPNTRPNNNKLSPRLQRLALALLERPRTIRELMDIVPTNNPAEYVARLRYDHGVAILCEHVKFTTVDGASSWYGRYHLAPGAVAKLDALLWKQ